MACFSNFASCYGGLGSKLQFTNWARISYPPAWRIARPAKGAGEVRGWRGGASLKGVRRRWPADCPPTAAATPRGAGGALFTKGVSFGTLWPNPDGTWNLPRGVGLPAPSL